MNEKRPERRSEERTALPRTEPSRYPLLTVTLYPFQTVHSVSDLSARGMCIDSELDLGELPELVDATLQLDDIGFDLKLRPVNYRRPRLGCEIMTATKGWGDHVGSYLDPVRMGRGLREISPAFSSVATETAHLRQFESGAGCDVLMWEERADVYEKIQLFYRWTLVEWSDQDGLRAGRSERPPLDSIENNRCLSSLFKLTAPPPRDILLPAQRLVEASNLPASARCLFFGGH